MIFSSPDSPRSPVISRLSLSLENLFNHRRNHPQPSRCVADGADAQAPDDREKSFWTWICRRNSCICSLSTCGDVDWWCTWLLSPLLPSSFARTLSDCADPNPNPPTLPQNTGKITGTHSQIIHRAPLLNMWLTHWESLWEIRLKNELFIRTWNAGLIGRRERKNTPTI